MIVKRVIRLIIRLDETAQTLHPIETEHAERARLILDGQPLPTRLFVPRNIFDSSLARCPMRENLENYYG